MKKIVLTDCFDTIISRNCLPEDIKKIWAQKASMLFMQKINADSLYNVRRSVECELFTKKYNNGEHGEFKIEEVYSLILDRLVVAGIIETKNEDLLQELLNIELEIEKKHQQRVAKTIKKLRSYKNNGAEIYIVSDFYMSEKYIWQFLNNLKIESLFNGIFVSCDYGLNKSSGSFYPFVLKELNIHASDCIMMGDNKIADVKKAKENNIKAKCIKKKNQKGIILTPEQTYKRFIKKELNKKSQYNYSRYAFSFFVFIDNLVKESKEKGIKKLYFLSREGQFLKLLYDEYAKVYNTGIPSYYLQVSRNSTFIASLQEIEKEEFNVLFRQYKDISVRDFLMSLTFTGEEISALQALENFNELDIDGEIKNFKNSSAFKLLKANSKFIEIYDKKRKEQKQLFKRYLKELDFNEETEELNIVDVGWKGSMQDNIYNIYDGKIKVNGLYIGLFETGSVKPGSTKKGLLFDFVSGGLSQRNQLLSFKHHYYESLLRANHSRVENYKLENGKVGIIYEETPDEEFYNTYLKEYHSEVLTKFKNLLKTCQKYEISNNVVNSLAARIHLMTMLKTNKKDLGLINASMTSFREGFGKVETLGINYSTKDFYLDKLRVIKRLIKYKKEKN